MSTNYPAISDEPRPFRYDAEIRSSEFDGDRANGGTWRAAGEQE